LGNLESSNLSTSIFRKIMEKEIIKTEQARFLFSNGFCPSLSDARRIVGMDKFDKVIANAKPLDNSK
jgi:hypothetical protein